MNRVYIYYETMVMYDGKEFVLKNTCSFNPKTSNEYIEDSLKEYVKSTYPDYKTDLIGKSYFYDGFICWLKSYKTIPKSHYTILNYYI